jgi:peptide chain release factor 1
MDIYKEGEALEREYIKLAEILSSPEARKDWECFKEQSRSLKELEPKVKAFREYKDTVQEVEKLSNWLDKEKDSDMVGLVEEELDGLQNKKEQLESNLKALLKPVSKEEQGNIIMEIRAGTGGEEASLFARDLFKMYSKFAERRGWRLEVMNSTFSDRGGFKEVVYAVEGEGTWAELKYELGVHRVQRVPETESAGRIHTSTATVAVLPEVGEVEVKINPSDLEIETYRASGPGGQHVNVTDSAVRIIHKPSGVKVQCQDERSQHQNKARALRVLKAKLIQYYTVKQQEERSETRKGQIKTGERSEKIRTYNFPQGRITDHRVNATIYRLKDILEGKLELITEPLKQDLEIK